MRNTSSLIGANRFSPKLHANLPVNPPATRPAKKSRWRKDATCLLAGAAASAMLGALASSAPAATNLYWGGGTSNIANSTPPAGGSGNWDLSTSNWSQDPTLGTTYQLWPTIGSSTIANFGNTAGTVTIDGTGIQANGLAFTTTGYTLTGSAINNLTLVGSTPTATVGAGITANINAPIAGLNGLTETGGGTLTLGGSNSYTGSTIVTNSSTLVLSNANAVQNSTLTESTGAGNLRFSSGIGTVNVGGLNWTDNITLTDQGSNAVNLSVGADNASTTYAGIFTGGSLTKVGNGMLTLSNTGAQGLANGTTLSAGYLRELGSSLGSGVISLGGGTLQLTSATANTYGNNVNVTGNSLILLDRGAAGAGVTQTFGNLSIGAPLLDVIANSFTTSGTTGVTFGNVTLNSATTLLVDGSTSAPGSVPTAVNTGSITGNFNLNVATQTGTTVTINGNIGTAGDTSILNKYGPGTLTIATGNTLNSSGQVNVTSGNLTIAGSATALNVANFVVNGGATLQLGTNGTTQVAQIGATANVTLNGGTLYGASPASSPGSGYVTASNNLIIGPGDSSFSGAGSTSTGTHVLQFNSFSRSVGGVFYAGPAENNFTTSDALFFGNYAAYGNGQDNTNNPANPAMVNSVIVGMLWNGDFATVNNSPAALGSNPNPSGGFPPIVISNITSLDFAGPTGNPQYGFYDALTLPQVGTSGFIPNDGTVNVLEEFSGTITLTGNINANALNVSPNSNPGTGAVSAVNGGTATPGALIYNLGGNALTLTTGELLASTIDGAGGNNYPIRIVNGTLTSSSSELFIMNSTSNSTWGIGAAITGAVSLIHGGSSTSAGAALYLSGENSYTGATYLDSPNAVNILTEHQLGAMPTSLVPNAIIMSSGSTLQLANNIPATFSPLRGITLNGGTSTIGVGNYSNINAAGTIDVIIPGPITGNGGIAFTGTGNVTLNGANTYDGQTIINGGNQYISFTTINNIGSGTPSSFGSPTNAYNGRIVFGSNNNNSILNYVGVGNASTDREIDLVDTRSESISAQGTGTLTLNGNIIGPNGGGTAIAGLNLGGNGVGVINGDIISTLTGGATTFTINIGGANNISPLDMWTLTGANNFDGGLTVSTNVTAQFTTIGTVGSGPSSLGAPSNAGNGTITLNTGVLRFVGTTSQSTDRLITVSGASSFEASGSGGAALSWNGNISTGSNTLTLGGWSAGNISSTITSTGGLTKGGQGTWTLNPTIAEAITSGTTSINNGTLALDFTNMTTPTNMLASTSTIALGGGTLSLLGKPGASTAQTVGALSTSANTGSQISLNSNGGTAISLTTGAVTRNGGSTLNINETGTAALTTGAITLTNGLLPWATINGADFATGVAAGGAISVFNAYTGTLPTITGGNANNYTLTGSQVQTGNTAFNALKITGSAGSQSLNLSGFNLTETSSPAAILFDGTAANYAYSITGPGNLGTGNVELITHVNNGTLTIAANISTGSGAFDKAGNGILVLSGNNTYTGRTNVNFGTLQAGSTTALSPSSALTVGLSGVTSGGFVAGTPGGSNTAVVSLGGFSNGVAALTGNGIVNDNAAAPANLTIGANAPLSGQYFASFTGLLQDGASGSLSIVKTGASQEILTGSVGNITTNWNDSYSGSLTIADGILDTAFINPVGANGPLGTSSTPITMGSTSHTGILGFAGLNALTTRNFAVAAGGGAGFDVTPDNTTTTQMIAQAVQSLYGATLNLAGNFTGSGPTLKLGQGNLILSGNNTAYTGNYLVTGGMLQFASNSSIGTGSTIALRDGGVVSISSAATDLTGGMSQSFINRVTVASDSVGVIALGSNSNSNLNFNTPNLANANLGAAVPLVYTGIITPYTVAGVGTYHLGGGGVQSSITFPNANQLTGNNNLVVTPGGSSNLITTASAAGQTMPATVVLGDAQSYTGSTTVSGGNALTFEAVTTGFIATNAGASLTLAGANASIASTSGVTLNNGGILRFIESPNDVSKLGTAPVTMNGGVLDQDTDGSSQWSYAQTVNSLTLNRGANTVYVTTAAGSSQSNVLTISTLNRTAGSTINFANNLNITTDQVVLSQGSGGLALPTAWAFVNSADYATFNGSNGNITALAAPATTVSTTWTSGTLDTADATASIPLTSASSALHTLRVTSTAAIPFGADSLAINGILAAGGAVTIGATGDTGTLTAPATGGEIDVAALGNAATILERMTDPASGTTTLVVSGIKGVTLGNATMPASASTYTGGIVLNQGTLTVANINSLPASSSGITVNGGYLTVTAGTSAAPVTWSNPVTINADAAFESAQYATYIGTLTLANGANLFVQAASGGVISGPIVGTGNIYYTGTTSQARVISGTSSNTYNGNTYLYGDENTTTGNGTGLAVTFNKSGGAYAIPGDLYLGRATETNSTNIGFAVKAIMGNNTDQFGPSTILYFGGGHGNDAGDLQIAGTTTQVVVGLQSTMPGDGLIENASANSGVLTINVPAGVTRTFSGAIVNNGNNTGAGNLGLNFGGPGTQILSGVNNTYSGATNVSGGTLTVGTTNALSPNSAVNLSGGTLDVSAYSQTIASFSATAGSTLNLGTGTLLTSTGAANFAGTLNIIGTPATLPDILMTYTSQTGSFSTTNNLPSGDSLTYLAGALEITSNSASAATLTWNNTGGTGNGITWDTIQQNWNNGSGAVAYSDTSNGASGDNVIFTEPNNGNYNVSIPAVVHPTSTTINATGNYTFNGAGGIGGPGGLTKMGTGSLALNTNNTYAGPTNISGGSITLGSANALPAGTTLTINGTGSSLVAGNLGNAYALQLGALTITGGKLDLENNALIVHSGSLAAVSALVQSGYSNGSFTGTGIISSTAANNSSRLTTLGVIQNSANGTPTGTVLHSTFEGDSSSNTDVLVKYTYYGDANLDGKVDGTDYSRIDASFLSELTGPNVTGWYNGDFNYDGVVNGSDYTLIDNAYNSQGALIAAEIATPTELIAGSVGSSVPEPTTLGLLGTGAIGLLRRRRRRNAK